MIHPTCFEEMNNNQFAASINGLTPLESKVFKALNDSVFATGLSFDSLSMQTDLRDAYQKVKDSVSPQQFAGVCSQLAQKNLYRNIICDGYEFPKKVVQYEGRRIQIRTDIAEIILADEVLNETSK